MSSRTVQKKKETSQNELRKMDSSTLNLGRVSDSETESGLIIFLSNISTSRLLFFHFKKRNVRTSEYFGTNQRRRSY